jgi:hypothetical protein
MSTSKNRKDSTDSKNNTMRNTRRNSTKLLVLEPKYEAALIAYIVFYYQCDKETCWETIGDLIREYGQRKKMIVYRGHDRKDSVIKNTTPFFSTSPNITMAELFVETNWSNEEGTKVGNLFKIHLLNALCINTSKIKYSISNDVIDELRKIIGDRKIQKGNTNYTFEEYIPHIRSTLNKLVFNRSTANDDEILVLNGGKFYKDKNKCERGYLSIKDKKGYTVRETWYVN